MINVHFFRRFIGAAIASLTIAGASNVMAAINISTPADWTVVVADPCPVGPCSAKVPFEVRITGSPIDALDLDFLSDTGEFTLPLCRPQSPVEGTPGCPTPPAILEPASPVPLPVGQWSVTARALHGSYTEISDTIEVLVLPSTNPAVGHVVLDSLEPLRGQPAILVRDASEPDFPGGIVTTPGEVTIYGANLHNNPFLEVYVAPIPVNEPTLLPGSALPVYDWCLYETEIIDGALTPTGESFVTVQLPELPRQAPSVCTPNPRPAGSIFTKNWRFVIRDRWNDAGHDPVHEWWAIPSPRPDPGHDTPPFRMVEPPYPELHGFGFKNHQTSARYYEFLTVFGNNAYYCLGVAGFCATRLPDPVYHVAWWEIYRPAINSGDGSCNGMSATSRLFERGDLTTEAFEADVHFPVGFLDPGPDSVQTTNDNGDVVFKGVAKYKDTNWCTPVCSPPKPNNLWATVRMNHGVQISLEFFFEALQTLGEAVFDPDDLTSMRGIPQATLERVASNPQGYVLCFFQPGKGHCVTPYRVEDNRIWIYDNNAPRDNGRYIDIIDGEYDYPARSKEPNHGHAIVAFPLEIWQEGRHLLGLEDLITVINGDFLEFLFMLVVGSADITVTNPAGGRWGWESDGTFTNAMLGAVAVGPFDTLDDTVVPTPLFLAMNQPAPTVQINADGGAYTFHTVAGGHLLQLQAQADSGDQDTVQLGYDSGKLNKIDFMPQERREGAVARVGLTLAENESLLFQWVGLDVPAGKSVGFDADKTARAASYRNDTGDASYHILVVDHASASAQSAGRSVYGPFEVPPGASQRILFNRWPEDVTAAVAELDFDRDGTPERTEVITGRATELPLAQNETADLAIEKTVIAGQASSGEMVHYRVVVSNAGPDEATGVTLIDALSDSATIGQVSTPSGECYQEDGLHCDLPRLAVGQTVAVSYSVRANVPGTLTNIAMVSGNESDDDLSNNTATAHVDIPLVIDIKPGNRNNPINPRSKGKIPVAILGTTGFDVREIDLHSLRFGPAGARPAHKAKGHFEDVNRDGVLDVLSHYKTRRTGIRLGDTQACVQARSLDGRAFTGCDHIKTKRQFR